MIRLEVLSIAGGKVTLSIETLRTGTEGKRIIESWEGSVGDSVTLGFRG